MRIIGVDIGTTSTKAVLFDENGAVLSTSNYGYPLFTPTVDTAEQSVHDIYQAVVDAIFSIAEVSDQEIDCISFSSAMHSLIVMDNENQPITNVITWADNRSYQAAERLKAFDASIYKRTGTPVHPMSPLSKIAWLKVEQPELFNKAAKFIGIKEYIFFQWFNRYVVDYSIASATGLFNIEACDYDEQLLRYLQIERSQLSEPVDGTTIFQGIDLSTAKLLGISPSTKFVIGASDGALSNIGLGAYKKGDIAVSIGTSGAIRTMSERPLLDPKGRLFCYRVTKDTFVIGGPVNNGGVVLQWVKDEIARGLSFEDMMAMARKVSAGSHGLIFHPYMSGERAPLWRSDVRGSYIGLTLHHGTAHMIRAAMEGILYNMNTVLIALSTLIESEHQVVKATGGFTNSSLWTQLMSDIFDMNVMIPKSSESACLGAVVMAMIAMDDRKDFSIVDEMIGETNMISPSEAVSAYREIMPIYIHLNEVLASEYPAIVEFQRKYT